MVSRCVSPYHPWSYETARYSLLVRHAKVWNLASSPQMAPGRAEMTMRAVTICICTVHIYFFYIILQPIGSMVLVYMLTWLGYIDGIHVTIYSSTMDPSWAIISYMEHICFFFEWPSKPEAFWVSGVSGVSRGLQQKSAGRADFHLSEQCRYGCLDAGPSAGCLLGLWAMANGIATELAMFNIQPSH